MFTPRRLFAIVAASLALIAAGCSIHADRLRDVRSEFYANHIETAGIQLDKYQKGYSREANNFKLDRAVVELSAGRPQEAEKILREVRDQFDYYDQASLAEKTAVLLTDDRAAAYAGEDYEKVLIRAMLAISNLMADGEDAAAYSLQTNDIQERIIQKGVDANGENRKLAYKRIALGAYLHGILREETNLNYDDAARSFVRVCSWEPDFAYGRQDYQRVTQGHHNERGNGVLYVFALVGRGPYKEQRSEIPTQLSLLLADQIISATGKHSVPPTVAPVKVPIVVASLQSWDVRGVRVAVDRRAVGETATITDVTKMAIQQYAEIYPEVIARAVARRAIKKGIIYGAKEGLKVGNDSGYNVLMDVGGIAWEAAEQADTRCWGLLPDRIQVLRVELPAGVHQVNLAPVGGFASSGSSTSTVKITEGRNSYMLANFADGRLIGRILTSENSELGGGKVPPMPIEPAAPIEPVSYNAPLPSAGQGIRD